MANFPGSLDSLTNPSAGDPLNTPSHSGQHATANDILEAVEAKVGTGASTPTSGTVLTGTGVGTSAWQTSVEVVTKTTVTLTDAQIKALPTASVEIVPAPGADKVILPISAYLVLHTPNYDAYTNVDEVIIGLDMRWRDDTQTADPILLAKDADLPLFLGGNYPRTLMVFTEPLTSAHGWDDAPGVNAALDLCAANDSPPVDFTGGAVDNSLDVIVFYTILDV